MLFTPIDQVCPRFLFFLLLFSSLILQTWLLNTTYSILFAIALFFEFFLVRAIFTETNTSFRHFLSLRGGESIASYHSRLNLQLWTNLAIRLSGAVVSLQSLDRSRLQHASDENFAILLPRPFAICDITLLSRPYVATSEMTM
jgi:hypothetical protein